MIESVEHPGQRFTTKLESIEEGRRYRLSLILNPDGPAGKMAATILVKTSSQTIPVLIYQPGARITLRLEGAAPDVARGLRELGHTVDVRPRFAGIGNMQGILVDLATGAMTAGADPRRTGYAIGW